MRLQTLLEGMWIFVIIILAIFIFSFVSKYISLFFILFFFFSIYFFRDPIRIVPKNDYHIISCADGKVTQIEMEEESEFLKEKRMKISIFLSVLDVHVNRAPMAGEVVYLKEHPGLYLDARHRDCSAKNAKMTWGFKSKWGNIVVRQITGKIARRLVAWSKVNDIVAQGQRFGMIRFGSRTDIYLPIGSEVKVKVGDKVLGGLTILAELPYDDTKEKS